MNTKIKTALRPSSEIQQEVDALIAHQRQAKKLFEGMATYYDGGQNDDSIDDAIDKAERLALQHAKLKGASDQLDIMSTNYIDGSYQVIVTDKVHHTDIYVMVFYQEGYGYIASDNEDDEE